MDDYHQKSGKVDQFVLLANRIDILISRARVQDRLKVAERELVFWKEFAPAAIVVDSDGEILTASLTSRELFDAGRLDALIGTDIRELVHPSEREESRAVMHQIQQGDGVFTCLDRKSITLGGELKRSTV